MQDKSETISNFGLRLKTAREKLRLTQPALAERWGKDKNYIWMLESGTKPFPQKLESLLLELESEAGIGLEESSRVERSEGKVFRQFEETGGYQMPTKDNCREYLDHFLEACGNNPSRVAWTLIELQKHFPLDEWERKGKAK